MTGERRIEQAALFYEFSLDRHVRADHLLRSIDRFVDLAAILPVPGLATLLTAWEKFNTPASECVLPAARRGAK